MDQINEKEIISEETEILDAETSLEENTKKGMSGKAKVIIAVVIIAFLALVGYRVYDNFIAEDEVEKTAAVSVKTAVAEVGEIFTESPVTAKIEAGQEVYVVPMAAGKVTSVNAKNGDYVKKGQVLLTVDDSTVSPQVSQAAEGVKQAQANVDRMRELYEAGAVSRVEYETAQSTLTNARLAYESASAATSFYTVTAPISGILSSFNVAVGAAVGQNMVGSISDTSRLKLNASVTENMALKIEEGDTVEIYIASLDKSFDGKVETFAGVPATGTVTYPVSISISNDDGTILPGMVAEVRIKTEKADFAVIVPSETVFTKNGESVAVVLNGNIPKIVKVETGIDNGDFVEILSGISEGDTVVISGQQYVKDGEEVKVY